MIKAILVFNNHGKPRLSKFYQYFDENLQQQIIKETFQLVSKRDDNVCNFLEGGSTIPDVATFPAGPDFILFEAFGYLLGILRPFFVESILRAGLTRYVIHRWATEQLGANCLSRISPIVELN
ncbi:uncharacterized protein LOC115760439 isoform X2 [Drosophila novamexicana]|uniref:uncharacterized protein LOC115760439 isoform X2 n=1 Tax=Drosophila novamexicana TaxID=47314 RepID=UPI0011E5D292|nr:uncharacterized protein LOC115760439 isoform X2 [Drosophila novamexicana]